MLPLLFQTLLVAGLLAVLVMIVGPVFRLSPAVRYGLWLVVLIKLLAPPVVDWPWDAPAVVGEAVTLPAFIRPAEAPVTPVRVVGESEGLTVRTPGGIRVTSLLWIVWALGSLVVFVTLTCRILRFRRVLSQSYPAPDHIVDIVEGVGRQLGIPAPAVRVVPGSSGPCVWSLGRPVVVIPGAMLANEDVAFWQYVLSHELAHIRRRDHWFVWLEFAGFVLWWWNPLFWLVGHRLRSNAEMAADNWAVSLNPDNRRQYAEALLWVAERGSRVGPAMPALGVSRRSRTQFAKRLTLILVGDHGVRVSMPGVVGLLFLMLVVWPAWELREVLPELVEATMPRGALETNLTATITVWPYDISTSGKVVLPETTRWVVRPNYNGGTARGGDDRLIVVLHDPVYRRGEATAFWPVIVSMPLSDARKLHADLSHVISTKLPTENERDGMESFIYTGMYSFANRYKRLGNQAAWRVMPRYSGVDEQGGVEVDDRVTVVLEDAANSFWPVIVRMDSGIAQNFVADLARVITEKSEGG